MPRKSKISIKSRSSFWIFILCLIFATTAYGSNGVMPIDDTEIKLSDGRVLLAKRHSIHSHWLILKKGTQVLWKKRYELEYDRVWNYAFFVPVKKNQYVYDVDYDGSPEVAIATWDGGNNIANRYALVFSVKDDQLKYYDRQRFNLEYGEYVYP